jgi:hypothetical protein
MFQLGSGSAAFRASIKTEVASALGLAIAPKLTVFLVGAYSAEGLSTDLLTNKHERMAAMKSSYAISESDRLVSLTPFSVAILTINDYQNANNSDE